MCASAWINQSGRQREPLQQSASNMASGNEFVISGGQENVLIQRKPSSVFAVEGEFPRAGESL